MTDVPADRTDRPGRYAIHVRGQLPDRWTDWFDGFTLTRRDDGTTVLTGVVDQSALHGALRTLADLGLPLLSVTPAAPTPASPTPASPTPTAPH
jgi:hypothetical protein